MTASDIDFSKPVASKNTAETEGDTPLPKAPTKAAKPTKPAKPRAPRKKKSTVLNVRTRGIYPINLHKIRIIVQPGTIQPVPDHEQVHTQLRLKTLELIEE